MMTARRNGSSYYYLYRRRRRKDKAKNKNAIRNLRKTKFNLDFETKLRRNIHKLVARKILRKNGLLKTQRAIKLMGKKRAVGI